MPNRRIYQGFFNQFSKLRAIKINKVTVGLTILTALLSTLITQCEAGKFVKSSVKRPLNLVTTPSLPAVKVASTSTQQKLKPSPVSSPLPTIQVVATSIQQKLKSPTPPPPVPDWAIAKSLPVPFRQPGKQDLEVIYNLKKPPTFKHSQKLQAIVNDVVQLATDRSLPKKPLSITLINPRTGEIAGFQQDTPRYPASVIKMFWMVVLYAQIESGFWAKDFSPYVTKMIQESDNEAASFILDKVTGTRSESKLKTEKLKLWLNKRQQVNRFFRQANYKKISIIQKTFPINYINLSEPEGSESQLLDNSQNWSRITTQHAARLLYEICYAQQAVSPQASKKMCKWLKRDLNPKVWQPPESYNFNPIRSFVGESLPHTRVKLYSKAGWTSFARAEVAMVVTEKSQATYILAIFAHDSAYADDAKIFPKMSSLVYKKMNSRSSK